jgi:Phytanoyl-CoA dioxygenase (PhyH)
VLNPTHATDSGPTISPATGSTRSPRVSADFARDGMVFPIRVFDDDALVRYRAGLEEVESLLGGQVKRLDWAYLFFDWAFEIVTHPRVAEPIAAILGPDVMVQSGRLLCKYPHDESFVGWHQDGLYSGLNTFASLTAWIALSDATPENGCLRVIPGSHRSGALPHIETYASNNLSNHGEQVSVPFDKDRAVDAALKAGEMSLHHVNLIHGSEANRSETTRIGFSVSYVTPEVGRATYPMVVVSGCRNTTGFELVTSAPRGTAAEALAGHAEFLQRHGHRPNRLR